MTRHGLLHHDPAAAMLRDASLLGLLASGVTPTGDEVHGLRRSDHPQVPRYGVYSSRSAEFSADAAAPKTGRKPLSP